MIRNCASAMAFLPAAAVSAAQPAHASRMEALQKIREGARGIARERRETRREIRREPLWD